MSIACGTESNALTISGIRRHSRGIHNLYEPNVTTIYTLCENHGSDLNILVLTLLLKDDMQDIIVSLVI